MGDGVCAACLLEEVLPAAEGLASPVSAHNLETDTALVQHFGPYELLEEIGRGGMGVIYQARQPGLDRIVALKMLLAGEFADAKTRERLLREARIAARLTHPGIVTIYEVGELQGRPYFAMEYVPGRNLAQHTRDGLLPVNTAVRYVEQLAHAVHYAHQHGVIHRDLKPANVLITPGDEPKLTDFGLTKSLVDPTRTIESAGSPNFMAPEQADSSLGATGTHTDVFGLGAMLYYLLTGRPPVVGETLSETLRAVVTCEPVLPTQLRPALPRDLETITLKCLEKEPARRYGGALNVAEELARWRNHEPIHARPATGVERLGKWVRRRPAVAALSAAVMVSLLGGLVATTWQWRRASRAADEARTAELAARRNSYGAEMTLADQAANAGNWTSVRTLLDRTRPEPGQTDLRGWEWRYLWQISRIGAESRFGGRTNPIYSIAPLPDGRTVALGEMEGGFSLWDASSGQLLYELPEAINRVRQQALSEGTRVVCRLAAVPGTTLLAYTDCRSPTNGYLHFWDTTRRETIRSVALPGMPRHLAVSPDGRLAACSLMLPDNRIFVCEVTGDQSITTLETVLSDYSYFSTLAFSADGRALGMEDAKDRCIRVVELSTGRDLHRFPLDQVFPLTLAFSPDGRWLVTGAGFEREHRIRVWDLETGRLKTELDGSSAFTLHFDRSGRRLMTGLSIWRVPEFTLERELTGTDPSFAASALLADGDTFLTEDGSGSVFRWSLSALPPQRGGQMLCESAKGMTLIPQGRGMLAVTPQGTVYRALAPQFDCELIPELGTNVAAVRWLDGRDRLAVARQDGSLSLHRTDTYAEESRFQATDEGAVEVFWLAKAGLLALRTADEQLQVWDLPTQTRTWEVPLLKWRELTPPTPDGRLHQIHADGRLFSYDPTRRELITRHLDHDNMHRLSFSRDGRWLLTTTPDGPKRLVDTRTWKSVSGLENSGINTPHGTAFWPEEPRVAFAGTHIVDLITGRALLHLEAEFVFVGSVFLSDDGSTLMAGQAQQPRAYVWWAPSWEEIRRREADGANLR